MNKALFSIAIVALFAAVACTPTNEAIQNPSAESTPTDTLPTPDPLRVIQAHPAETYVHISWSPDGRWFASGGWDDKVIVWDTATLEPVYTLTHPEMTFSEFTSFSPNGRWLMVSEGWLIENNDVQALQAFDEVGIWDLETGTRLQRVTDNVNVDKAVWSPDGNVLAYTISTTNEIQYWVAPGAATTVPEFVIDPAARIGSMRWLADGTLMAITSLEGEPGKLFLWRSTNPETRLPLQGSYVDASASDASFSADGSWLAAYVSVPAAATANGVAPNLYVWNTVTGELRFTLPFHELYGFDAIISGANPSLLAIAKKPADKASEVRIWDLASGGVIATLPGASSSIARMAFSPDGRTLAAGETNGAIRLWQLDAYLHPPVASTPIPTTTPVPVSNVSLAYVDSFTVSGVNPDEPEYLNSIRWLDDGTLQGGGYLKNTFSPDRSKVAYWDVGDMSGPEATLFGVYEAATNEPLFQIQGSPQFLSGGNDRIAWAPDGKRIAVQSPKMIQVFEVPTGDHVMTMENAIEQDELVVYDKLLWSPDGAWIASNLQGPVARSRVVIWDAATGEIHHVYEQEPANDPSTVVDHIAFSPDSSRLLLVKGNVEVLEVLTGELQTLPAGTELSQFVGTGAWSSDGIYVAVDYREYYMHTASVLIWNTQTGEFSILLRRMTEMYSDALLVWAPNRPWLATIDQGVVHILDAEKQTAIQLEPRTITTPRVVSWSPDGSQLAVGSEDRTVEVWTFSE